MSSEALVQKLKERLREDETARREVLKAFGNDAPSMTYKSAADIYRNALDKLHIPSDTYAGVNDLDVLRKLFLFAVENKQLLPNKQPLAADSAELAIKFPNAMRQIRIL